MYANHKITDTINCKNIFRIRTLQNAKLSFSEGKRLFVKLTSLCSENNGLWRDSNASQF